jgi:hypothetical protein
VESTAEALGEPNATGFRVKCQNNAATTGNYVYIAIRRGPMKVPTDGTTVFSPIASSAAGGTALTTNFPVDLQMYGIRAGDAANITTSDRLRGVSTTSTAGGNFIVTSSTAAETGGSYTRQWGNTGFVMPVGIGSQSGIFWNFRRAPSFFDEVCYTGTGSATTFNHNLGVAPELMIVKPRSQVLGWPVWNKTIYAANADNIMYLDQTGGQQVVATMWNSAAPTSTTFPVGTNARTNSSAATYVAYLFATCPGVSKVGSYTGTGATQTIDCGFTGGARFVLIKRTNSTGGWAVFDTARGMVAGSDYSSDLNTTAAELNSNEVYTITTGFQLVSASTSYNASGSTYIYLAIA